MTLSQKLKHIGDKIAGAVEPSPSPTRLAPGAGQSATSEGTAPTVGQGNAGKAFLDDTTKGTDPTFAGQHTSTGPQTNTKGAYGASGADALGPAPPLPPPKGAYDSQSDNVFSGVGSANPESRNVDHHQQTDLDQQRYTNTGHHDANALPSGISGSNAIVPPTRQRQDNDNISPSRQHELANISGAAAASNELRGTHPELHHRNQDGIRAPTDDFAGTGTRTTHDRRGDNQLDQPNTKNDFNSSPTSNRQHDLTSLGGVAAVNHQLRGDYDNQRDNIHGDRNDNSAGSRSPNVQPDLTRFSGVNAVNSQIRGTDNQGGGEHSQQHANQRDFESNGPSSARGQQGRDLTTLGGVNAVTNQLHGTSLENSNSNDNASRRDDTTSHGRKDASAAERLLQNEPLKQQQQQQRYDNDSNSNDHSARHNDDTSSSNRGAGSAAERLLQNEPLKKQQQQQQQYGGDSNSNSNDYADASSNNRGAGSAAERLLQNEPLKQQQQQHGGNSNSNSNDYADESSNNRGAGSAAERLLQNEPLKQQQYGNDSNSNEHSARRRDDATSNDRDAFSTGQRHQQNDSRNEQQQFGNSFQGIAQNTRGTDEPSMKFAGIHDGVGPNSNQLPAQKWAGIHDGVGGQATQQFSQGNAQQQEGRIPGAYDV